MWPWGHLAVGYLFARSYQGFTAGRLPVGSEVWLVSFGALLPDLIDKPLSWSFHLLPSGRMLAHSFLSILFAGFLIHWVVDSSRRRKQVGMVFLGVISHSMADGLRGYSAGGVEGLKFLIWPVTTPESYSTYPSFSARFVELGQDFILLSRGQYGETGFLAYELLLVSLVVLLWARDGSPGWDFMRKQARHVYAWAFDKPVKP